MSKFWPGTAEKNLSSATGIGIGIGPGNESAPLGYRCNPLPLSYGGTRVKTHKLLQVCKQVVTSLFTSCQQVVFALLVPSLL